VDGGSASHKAAPTQGNKNTQQKEVDIQNSSGIQPNNLSIRAHDIHSSFLTNKESKIRADHSGRAVYGMNYLLRSLERWELGFESHSRH
jgi:hypothetical protein